MTQELPDNPFTRESGSPEQVPQTVQLHHHGSDVGPDPFAPNGVTFTPVSPKLTGYRLTIAGIWILILTILVVVMGVIFGEITNGWVWLSLIVPVGLAIWLGWLIPRQVRVMGYAETEHDLMVRKGKMWRSLNVVPYGRLQYVDVQTGPIQRAFGITTVQLNTAAAVTDALIPGIPPEEAARLRQRLSEAGESQLAGL